MFLPECLSGSTTPRAINTTFQPTSVTGAPTHTMATFKGNCPTSRAGVVGQTFVAKCPSGSGGGTFQPACPTGAKTP
jgi:hypothetical protein